MKFSSIYNSIIPNQRLHVKIFKLSYIFGAKALSTNLSFTPFLVQTIEPTQGKQKAGRQFRCEYSSDSVNNISVEERYSIFAMTLLKSTFDRKVTKMAKISIAERPLQSNKNIYKKGGIFIKIFGEFFSKKQ